MKPPPPLPFAFFHLLLLLSAASAAVTSHSPPVISPTTSPSPPVISPTSSPSPPVNSPTASPSPTKSPTRPTTSTSILDPKQLTALQSLSIPISKNPCAQPSLHNATFCDDSSPFRHLISLSLTNCSADVSLSITALKSLSTLQDLTFIDCPVTPVRFPAELISSLRSFTSINSLKRLSGVFLSRLQNLTDLTVVGTPINTRGLFVVFANMKALKSAVISNANVTGSLPKHWDLSLTHIDFSNNKLKGSIPGTLNVLQNLQSLNLSSNELSGEIPSSLGDLLTLTNVSLSFNSLSGPIPGEMSTMKKLVHIDFSSNQLNGSIPKFVSELKNLRYLNLENNNFQGVMPFNGNFIERLDVFKIGGNSNLCYNHSSISSKVKLGIAPCDKHGLPVSPPPAKDTGGDSNDDYSDDSSSDSSGKKSSHHGPNKVVLGVAIALSSIVFLIVFLICISKRCR